MDIDASCFITADSDPETECSFETTWFHFSRQQVGGRLLLRKSLKQEVLSDQNLRETLRKEYAIGSSLGISTDYVVSYYQMVDTPESCYLTMDYVDGSTLSELLIVDPDYMCHRTQFLRFLTQLLEGLSVIHRNQVVHLDLKPTNIMLTRVNHDVRIIDLGFSYSDAFKTSMGMTNSFAAPEQLDGSGDVDARTDIYVIGLLLQWLAKELGEKCQWKKDWQMKKLISRCLSPQKSSRWQSVEEMLEYIQRSRSNHHWELGILNTIVFVCAMSLLYFLFSRPVLGYDHHVLYGNFSLLDGTCDAVGKIQDDHSDPYWEGNLYVASEVHHWGMKYTVTAIADNAFLGDTTFSTISLPSTLKRIGQESFKKCVNLKAIRIPNSVEELGAYAFWRDSCLSQVQLPSAIQKIPSSCFHLCAFSSVVIPEGVKEIELDAFAMCPNLSQVILPQSLENLGRGVFWRCESLESIVLPERVSSIGEYAFMGCSKIRQIENHAIDPQSVMSLFDDSIPEIRLLVPEASVDLYKQSDEWKRLSVAPLTVL